MDLHYKLFKLLLFHVGDNGDNGNEVTYNCKEKMRILCENQAITGS